MTLLELIAELDITGQTWRDQAACRGMNPNIWYPAPHDVATHQHAIKICNTCPVKTECLAYGLTYEDHGIHGGTSERSKRKIRHQLHIKLRERPANTAPWLGPYRGGGTGDSIAGRSAEQQWKLEAGWCPRCVAGLHGVCRFCACRVCWPHGHRQESA